MKYLTYLASTLLLAAVVLFLGACEREKEEEQVTSLISSSVSTPPVLDGNSTDAAWDRADEFVITVGSSASHANAFGEVDVSLRSVHTATDVYILASWQDPSLTENVDKKLWSYESGEWTQSGNEDRLFLMFDAGDNGSEGADCATMCHVGEGAMYTTGGGHVDVWHWKAHRTNPIGLADDKWWDGTGRGSDAKTISAYKDNATGSGNYPAYAGPITDGHFIIIAEGASTADLEVFDSTDVTLQANTYPGYYLNANATNSGESRHDVKAAGKYVNGEWTVELKRALDTGHDDDVVFQVGSTTQFSIAITDNSGGSHSGAGVFDFTIE
ncbi:MAG: ethylbenzene dehydrogenase-related protein [Fidelibacterota bacterium]